MTSCLPIILSVVSFVVITAVLAESNWNGMLRGYYPPYYNPYLTQYWATNYSDAYQRPKESYLGNWFFTNYEDNMASRYGANRKGNSEQVQFGPYIYQPIPENNIAPLIIGKELAKEDKVKTTTKATTTKKTTTAKPEKTTKGKTTTKTESTTTKGKTTTKTESTTVKGKTNTKEKSAKTTSRPTASSKGSTTPMTKTTKKPTVTPTMLVPALPSTIASTLMPLFGHRYGEQQVETGQACSFEGEWQSESLRITFNSEAGRGGTLNIKLLLGKTKSKDMILDPAKWLFRGEAPLDTGGPICITGFDKADQLMTAFIGFCRSFNGEDIVSGTWLIGRSAKDFNDAHLSVRIIQDILKKSNHIPTPKGKG